MSDHRYWIEKHWRFRGELLGNKSPTSPEQLRQASVQATGTRHMFPK